jgi:orotidine-5'-phosphate decarboxylase
LTEPYLERLARRTAAVRSVLCLGLDPDPASLPRGFSPDVAGVERFVRLIIEAAAPYAAAIKPNLAFYEALGSEGLAALERIRADIPAGIPVVIDAKRADIGSTAGRHAVALYDRLGADAVTVNPYPGGAAIRPLFERLDRYAYVLCRTSNPEAAEFQNLVVSEDAELGAPSEPLHVRVARRVVGWGPGGTVGLVVGATAPAELHAIRAVAPGLGILVPGIGAQGGEIAPVLRDGPAIGPPASAGIGQGLLVNVSRAISAAALAESAGGRLDDPGERLAAAARDWALRLPVLP